jgi:hypothetical protein
MTSVAVQQILIKKEETAAARERIAEHIPAETGMRMRGFFCAGRAEKLRRIRMATGVSKPVLSNTQLEGSRCS